MNDYWLSKAKIPAKLDVILDKYKDKNLHLLDLGCGGGRVAVSLAKHFASVSGVDVSYSLIRDAKSRFKNVSFHHGNYLNKYTWCRLNRNFDLAVSNCAIRKDTCPDLGKLVSLCGRYVDNYVFRVQNNYDLRSVLPVDLRDKLFYNDDELREAFKGCKIIHDVYRQKFSTLEYMRKFLIRIGINSDFTCDLRPYRSYSIVVGNFL